MTDQVYIGVDFGKRRIGMARSDASAQIASAYKTITYKSINIAIEEIVADLTEYEAVGVVVGNPVAPDGGDRGGSCKMVDDFISRLEKLIDIPIYKTDERDSSVEAEAMIHMHGKKVGKDKGRLDRMAAAIILQRFLDERSNNKL
ncbi:MAG: Holliday junction resolvase RuvX [candidate division Zixibacteria bacterium]|nr:Holliday junction resolvase RuvX [candidate division Zixibacteria bacterium]